MAGEAVLAMSKTIMSVYAVTQVHHAIRNEVSQERIILIECSYRLKARSADP
jgi:hypothetical protein